MFPPTDIGDWGARGTEGGPWASFFRRYQRPLVHYAMRRFALTAEVAEELTSRFLAREIVREQAGEAAIFRLWDPGRGRFRSLLATSFWRFARDELAKEQLRATVDAVPETEADDEFCRLVAREFFEVVRQRIAPECADEQERAVLQLKWPTDPHAEPLGNAEVERRLGLSRQSVRTATRRIGERFATHLRAVAHAAGLTPGELDPFLADVCRVLDESPR